MFKNIVNHPTPAVVGAVVGTLVCPVIGTFIGAQIAAHIAHKREEAGRETLDDVVGLGKKEPPKG